MPTSEAAPHAAAAAALTFAELLAYERETLSRWADYVAAHPEALALPFDAGGGDARMATVRGVIHHIAAVERRYADRLAGDPVTPYDAVPSAPADALLAAARDAHDRLARWVAGASEADLARTIEFRTISAGAFRASARKIVAHALLHGVRHWAQLASHLRAAGRPAGWGHDLLLSDALA